MKIEINLRLPWAEQDPAVLTQQVPSNAVGGTRHKITTCERIYEVAIIMQESRGQSRSWRPAYEVQRKEKSKGAEKSAYKDNQTNEQTTDQSRHTFKLVAPNRFSLRSALSLSPKFGL